MGRPPLPVGTFGKIDFLVLGKARVRARASVRDYDGHRRLVTRYGTSRAHAERRLREALRDRGTGHDPVAGMTSRLTDVANLWLAEVDDSDLAWGTKRLYRFTVESYVLPGLGELRLREVTVPAVGPAARNGAKQSRHRGGQVHPQRAVRHPRPGRAARASPQQPGPGSRDPAQRPHLLRPPGR